MREVQAVNFSIGYNYHQNELTIINPNGEPIKVSQQPNLVPLMIQIPPVVPNYMAVHGGRQIQQSAQYGFAVQTTHSTSFLLLTARERDTCRLSPTVPNIAGFCDWCGRAYDQIRLGILGECMLATAYDAETVRDRKMRSRAFIDGFEAALFTFKNAGLLQPISCLEPVVQQ